MKSIYKYLLESKSKKQKLLAVFIDPDKLNLNNIGLLSQKKFINRLQNKFLVLLVVVFENFRLLIMQIARADLEVIGTASCRILFF